MSMDQDIGGEPGADTQGFEQLRGVLIARDDDGDGASWRYRPLNPGLAPAADGRAQFALIGAGAVTMLALTAMWGVPATTLEALRADLAARAQVPASQVSLSPMAVEIGEVRLMLGDGQGAYVELAKARSSGVPPYHAAFNLMLDQAQAEKVRKALNGETGWLELRYSVTDAASPRRERSSHESESMRVDASVRRDGAQADASLDARGEARVESATAHEPPRTRSYSADAAHWGLPKP